MSSSVTFLCYTGERRGAEILALVWCSTAKIVGLQLTKSWIKVGLWVHFVVVYSPPFCPATTVWWKCQGRPRTPRLKVKLFLSVFSVCAMSMLDWAPDGAFGPLGSLSFSFPCAAFRESSQNHDSVCFCASEFHCDCWTPHPIFLSWYLCSVTWGKLRDKGKIDTQGWFPIGL